MQFPKERSISTGLTQRSVSSNDKELTLNDIWSVFLRRKGIVLGTAAVFLGLAILICVFSTRRYQASGEVQVQADNADALGLENITGGPGAANDALNANLTLQTQAHVLESDSLAFKVIKDLNLEQNKDFRPKFSPLGWVMGLMTPGGPSDARGAALEDAPGRRAHVLRVFSDNLSAKPVAGTRLIEIKYLNSDPKVAAAVVNHLTEALIDYNFQTRFAATQQATAWLGGQLADLRKQSEDLQAKVALLQRDSGVFSLGETDATGREQTYTPVLDRLQQATTQLAQAQSNRILKLAVLEVVKSGDPELISGLAGSSVMSAAPAGTGNSLSLIQTLRAQEAVTRGELNELSAKFGSSYPKLAEVRASLDGTEKAIHVEAERVAQRADNDYRMSQRVEDSARAVFLNEKRQADTLNDKAIEYQIVRQEAVQSRTLYQNLLSRLKEAGVVAGLRSSNITIVNPAQTPSRPAKPNVPLYLAAALISGLILGGCGALFRDASDKTIRDLPELESWLGGRPFGILPYHSNRAGLKAASADGASIPVFGSLNPDVSATNSLAAIMDPWAAYTEAVRAVRTSLMFAWGQAPPQTILVTSSSYGEGKSMLSANLAIVLAQQSKKVLLVDGDLRRPVLHKHWNLKMEVGLSSILLSDDIRESAMTVPIRVEGLPWLRVAAGGPAATQPVELLASEQMVEAMRIWREEYDFIIIDGAPVLPVTDSIVLSNYADLTLVVARYKMTERQSLETSLSMLQSHTRRKQIGVVLNAVERSDHNYYGYGAFNELSEFRA